MKSGQKLIGVNRDKVIIKLNSHFFSIRHSSPNYRSGLKTQITGGTNEIKGSCFTQAQVGQTVWVKGEGYKIINISGNTAWVDKKFPETLESYYTYLSFTLDNIELKNLTFVLDNITQQFELLYTYQSKIENVIFKNDDSDGSIYYNIAIKLNMSLTLKNIKFKGVSGSLNYNVDTKVQNVISDTYFSVKDKMSSIESSSGFSCLDFTNVSNCSLFDLKTYTYFPKNTVNVIMSNKPYSYIVGGNITNLYSWGVLTGSLLDINKNTLLSNILNDSYLDYTFQIFTSNFDCLAISNLYTNSNYLMWSGNSKKVENLFISNAYIKNYETSLFENSPVSQLYLTNAKIQHTGTEAGIFSLSNSLISNCKLQLKEISSSNSSSLFSNCIFTEEITISGAKCSFSNCCFLQKVLVNGNNNILTSCFFEDALEINGNNNIIKDNQYHLSITDNGSNNIVKDNIQF